MNVSEDTKIQEQLLSGNVPTRKLRDDIPTEEIDLPSQGKYYSIGNPLSTGKILLRYPTALEEDILTSKSLIQKGTVIDNFLQALIVDKNINFDDILLGDKNALVIASRILAYGKEYPVEVQCNSCKTTNKVVIDISDIQHKEIKDIDTISGNDFETILPASKATVRFKLLTHGDDIQISSALKQLKKSINIQASPEMSTRMLYSIISVNGNTDKLSIKKFVNSMLTADTKALRDEIYNVSPDIDMDFLFQCTECGHEERMSMPLGINFFWPNSKSNRF